ncbi:MAG: MBL fold metallo-hydrolase [Chloroflexota bacterium]
MIEGLEIAAEVWVLRTVETGRNTGVILGESGSTVVDPGAETEEINAVDRFMVDMESKVEAVAFTGNVDVLPFIAKWPEASAIPHSDLGIAHPAAPGWEMTPLNDTGRMGLYSKKSRIIFCGDMLRSDTIPNLKSGLDGYLEALDRIEALDIKVVVPLYGVEARGKREIKARIEQDRSYTLSLLRHVATARAANAPLERVLAVAEQVYEDYPHLQAHLRNIEYAWS